MYQVLHPEQNRLLSVREYARSQGFRCVELLIIMEKVKRSYNFAQPKPQPELLSAMRDWKCCAAAPWQGR